MSALPPRFEITAREIEAVMTRFYARIRKDDTLGPIFAAHVQDWPAHEAKIARFWKKTILHERGYEGNPMMVHRGVSQMRAEHFEIWLALFDETLAEMLTPQTCAAWSALAHRIGRGLRLGIEARDAPEGSVPFLR